MGVTERVMRMLTLLVIWNLCSVVMTLDIACFYYLYYGMLSLVK